MYPPPCLQPTTYWKSLTSSSMGSSCTSMLTRTLPGGFFPPFSTYRRVGSTCDRPLISGEPPTSSPKASWILRVVVTAKGRMPIQTRGWDVQRAANSGIAADSISGHVENGMWVKGRQHIIIYQHNISDASCALLIPYLFGGACAFTSYILRTYRDNSAVLQAIPPRAILNTAQPLLRPTRWQTCLTPETTRWEAKDRNISIVQPVSHLWRSRYR